MFKLKKLIGLFLLLFVLAFSVNCFAADGDEFSTNSFRIDGNGQVISKKLIEVVTATLDTIGDSLTLVGDSDGFWYCMDRVGTWVDNN